MKQSVFLYGTLRHIPLLSVVLECDATTIVARQATIADHRVSRVDGHDFPMLHVAPGEMSSGLLLCDLSAEARGKLAYYEGDFGYSFQHRLVQCDGQAINAEVFVPDDGLWSPAEIWSLENWVSEFGAFTETLAVEKMRSRPYMPKNGVLPKPAEMMMKLRAAAQLNADKRPGPRDRDLSRDVVVHRSERKYAGFFAYDEVDLQYRRYDGTMSEVMNRGYLAHTEAVVVLVYDPVRDEVLIVEQFRAPIFAAGDLSPWTREAVAGLIDLGETPEQAACREAFEEAGVEITKLHRIGPAYSSTGSMTEYLHFFVGLADLSIYGGGGVEAEGEDIRVEILSFDDAMDWVDTGHCKDAPTLLTMLWLVRHRDRLRSVG